MQSENFDKKVREAAEHHHPAYDEKAWDNMEKLLDKHLPQKKDSNRRFIFFLLLFLLLGGGSWLLITRPWKQHDKVAETNQLTVSKNISSGPVSSSKPAGDGEQLKTENGTITNEVSGIDPVNKTNTVPVSKTISQFNKQDKETTDKKKTNKNGLLAEANQQDITSSQSIPGVGKKAKQDNNPPVNILQSDPVITSKDNGTSPVINSNTAPKNNTVTDNNNTQPAAGDKKPDAVVQKPDDKKEGTPTETITAKSKKEKNKKHNSLSFTLSAGPDLSFVGSGNSSKVKLLTGAGFEYTIKDRISIRTGFYSARKIYSAKPSDYKAPPEFYQFYPYLQKVDANCRVYEIPVSIAYNFGKKTSEKWFVSAGISSFLMNEETYNYFYKYTPTGNTYTNKWSIKNENYNVFSVGTLSVGYKRNIGKRVTIMAEPYMKVPFSGVGYGKVKLNSGGVLFTAGIKLF